MKKGSVLNSLEAKALKLQDLIQCHNFLPVTIMTSKPSRGKWCCKQSYDLSIILWIKYFQPHLVHLSQPCATRWSSDILVGLDTKSSSVHQACLHRSRKLNKKIPCSHVMTTRLIFFLKQALLF